MQPVKLYISNVADPIKLDPVPQDIRLTIGHRALQITISEDPAEGLLISAGYIGSMPTDFVARLSHSMEPID